MLPLLLAHFGLRVVLHHPIIQNDDNCKLFCTIFFGYIAVYAFNEKLIKISIPIFDGLLLCFFMFVIVIIVIFSTAIKAAVVSNTLERMFILKTALDEGVYYTPEALMPIYRDEIIPLANVVTPNCFEFEYHTFSFCLVIDFIFGI